MIPETIAEVTPEWLSACLNRKITGMAPEQIGQGIGIMGDIYRVGLTYAEPSDAAPASVVVKLPSSFEENRAQGVALGMFEAEVRFYNELAREVSAGLPQVFHAEIASGTASFVIVMEDLSHMITVPQAQGMTVSQAQAAAEVLARVHATWWGKTDAPELAWIPSLSGERAQHMAPVLAQLLPVFLDGFGEHLPSGGRELYEAFAGNYYHMLCGFTARAPSTVAHLDFRVENLMFRAPDAAPTGPEVVVLDWQGLGRGPGAYDLAYILAGSMPAEARRGAESALLNTYHQQLQTSGVADYSLDALTEDYAFAQVLGGLATPLLIGGSMDLGNERGKELIATMARRHVAAALDHDGLARIKTLIGE